MSEVSRNGGSKPNRGPSIERMPPQAVEVEQAVLGAMLIDGRAVSRAIELLNPDCFYHGPHGKIYQAVLNLYERSEAIDQLTVAEELKRQGFLDEVGGRVQLASLAAGVATGANLEYHARIVLDRFMRRRLIEDASEITERAYTDSAETEELLGWAESKIFAIAQGQINQGFEPLETIMSDTFEEIERAHNRVSTVAGVDTGFTDLNEMTSGFQKGDLIILAARPSVGKTAFALSIARNAAVDGGNGVAVFSCEMNKQQIAQRLLSTETRVDLHRLRTGRLTDEDFMHLTKRVGKLAQAPIYVDDTPGITVLEARAKARRLQREYGIGLIIVDYLQLMTSHENIQSRVEEISRISRGLKGLAKELDVPVLSLSQLSRAVESRTDRRPQLSDLRESGCLSGDTLVVRADTGQRVPIKDLVGQRDVSVWALNEATQKIQKAAVSNAFCTGTKPVYRLTTRLGRQIRATGNHKFLTIEGWSRLDELAPGGHIALPRKLETPYRQTLADDQLALLGHLIGDGCVLPKHAVQYTTMCNNLANEVCRQGVAVFGDSIRPHISRQTQASGKKLYQVFLASSDSLARNRKNPVAAWFESLGIAGLRSYEKKVPEAVFGQPEGAIGIFLRHLWATDGAIKMSPAGPKALPRIYYASSSHRLALDVQSLLLRLGINARCKRIGQKGKGRDQFHVTVSGKPDIAAFVDRVGTVGTYRLEEITQIRHYLDGRRHNTNRDVIPRQVWHTMAVPAMERAGISQRQMQAGLGMQYCGTGLFKNHIGRQRAARLAQAVDSPEISALAASDIYWDEVVEIVADGCEEVYDLTVPHGHNFVAGDIIVHNSIEQDADVVMFIYRPDIYGLKSADGGSLEGLAEIIIGKQRNGPTGSVHLMWNAECASYENMASDWRVEPEEEY